MNRKITFAEGEYYHVYNRGVEKRDIFMDRSDRVRFHRMLHISNSTRPVVYKLIQRLPLDKIEVDDKIVAIGAYVLMNNHFHLLVKEISEGGVSTFMEKLTTSYSKYFNLKNKRVGPLFQGRFKAEHVDSDEYLKYLYAYIHLNPVKLIEPEWKEGGIKNLSAAKKYLEGYRYSSYEDYAVGKREESAILSPSEFPDYFENTGDFAKFVEEWLDYEKEQVEKAVD
ncbi:MAG: hypothetical protein A2845_06075 [Candidatus Lloydbacteria bacterium RIFCSPHIGHO2_01_FULL_49_22]|uniref:Transposase IS200-like domain-containing protein n=1 Tax=Candidatus Lloydbacteria bacterium RIFCSPHIGHO2_01_FULL_49_22 TaxID=1798658 RepID=A0A1G2CYV8_9BACT|nr:MAG: hypothetical protein A2845_06075 [Candidatus Lloydbacteria bacterium RIFCSPHIGHO2_01_FULL_49_22]OGZ08811.1 MAG: hypothetical protein A3C14_01085 [Candidatus Lloydbacteria bacterium RIFCSPHIGHO2_02_FULL_50_18]